MASFECQCVQSRSNLQRLTRRANQGHIGIITDIVSPAPQFRQRAFHFAKDDRPKQFQFVETVLSNSRQFVDGSKMV
jgi:hypothetical protein